MISKKQKLIIDDIRQRKWWIMNKKEIAEYYKEEIPKNYNPDEVLFLSLSHNKEIDNNWLKKIGELTSLKSLHIDKTNISDKGVQYLESLKNLRHLNLRGVNITDSSLEVISKLASLEALWLNDTKIEGKKLNLLSNCKNLNELFLGKTYISDKTLKSVSELSELEDLSVSDTKITLKSLSLFRSLPNLKYLDITNTGINEYEVENLKKEFPKMIIHHVDW